jgi:hypothetical protein
MSRKIVWLGMVLIVITGLIHVIDAPDSFHDAAYKGWLFYANGVGAVLAAYGIYRSKLILGWSLGLFIAAASIVFYVASRTIGLPLLPAEPDAWLEPLGIASLITEALFIVTFLIIVHQKYNKRRQI